MKMDIRSYLYYVKNYLRRYLNLIVFWFSGNYYSNRKKILSYRNKYKGKRCFIVCNGPSLSSKDLTKIYESGDISIAMNHIALIYDETPWRPQLLMVTDDVVYTKKNKRIIQKCEAGVKVFRNSDYLRSLSFEGEKIYVSISNSRRLLDNPMFSENLEDKIYAIGTTAYEAIEWARYIGAESIFLLGCDMAYAVNMNKDGSIYYNDSNLNHFYGKEKDVLSHIKPVQTWEQQYAHKAAEDYSRKHGFRIFNATRGGCLDEYERVSFDELFDKSTQLK